MTAGNNVIKATALTALKGKKIKAIFACLILFFSVFIGGYTSSLFSIFGGEILTFVLNFIFFAFIYTPLFLGILRFIWRILFGADDNPISVFYYFSQKKLYKKILKFLSLLLIRIVPLGVLVSLPAVFARVISLGKVFEYFKMPIPMWAANISYAYIFLSTIAFVIMLLYSLKFYIAPVLLVADENMDAAEAIHMSTVISKKTSLEFLYLVFGFLGWILISVLVIPAIFVLPYFLTAYAVHVRFAVAEYNMHIKKSFEDDTPTFVTGVE